jgi:Predicted Zn-dependent hydrolases of the beta-lactamase fold
MRITWIGHSTVLLELDGVRLVTDPVLRPRVTHLRRTGIADTTKLGGVDAVLISHVHYDHLDLASLRSLGPVRIIVPSGAARRCAGAASTMSSSSPRTRSCSSAA